ncbi:MAG: glycosyltransferase family 9 protein, partial [Moraxellaceae bacterium]|nr:glycosyltransferase family 9 protein [Moraxellaceae bacterium]
KLWRQTRKVSWDQVIDLRGSATAHLLRARSRHVLGRQGRGLHRVLAYAEVLGLEASDPAPGFFLSPETQGTADRWLAGSGDILAMAPAANWIGKTWPAERFAALAKALLGPEGPFPQGRLLLLGGREDAPAAAVVAQAVAPERVIHALGEPELLITYAMLRRARLFVGNDSGMMHLAAAAGAPTLGLFGPTDDTLYAPWGDHCAVVRASPFSVFKARDPQLNLPEPHMVSLDEASVKAAALALLARTEGVAP